MTYGYEDPVVMPTMQVYDTDLAKMYIAGIKDLYDKAQEEMKDFMKLYQDFYSPIAGDTQAYHDATIGGAQAMIADMLSKGIDPYRSPEARAAISRYINTAPTGQLAAMKLSAENALTYLKMKAELQSKGKWNQAYEDYLLGGKSLDNWNTATDGVWNRLSPNEYSSLFDSTNPMFANMKDSYIKSDDKYDYYGVTTDQMRPILDASLADYLNSDLGKFHYNTFVNQLAPGTSSEDAMNKFKNEIMRQNERIVHVDRKENLYALDNYKTNNNIRAHAANAATDYAYKVKEWSDPNNPKNKESQEQGGGGQDYASDIYYQGVGKLFNLDPISASVGISNGTIGKEIYKREVALLHSRKKSDGQYDYDKIIKDHTIPGSIIENADMLGVVTGGSVPYGSKSKTIGQDQYRYEHGRDSEKIISKERLVSATAGYGSLINDSENFENNKKNSTYHTVTDEVVTHLSKGGRVQQYVKVLMYDSGGKLLDVGYRKANRSMKNKYGLSFSSKGSHDQPMALDITSDYTGRKVNSARATQNYAGKDEKDSRVFAQDYK